MPINTTPTLSIVYADAHMVVVNKPPGLLAVPGRGADKQDCASLQVQQQYADALVVHRLDQATSGLMLLARGAAMQRALGSLFESRAVHKDYVAVVHGLLHDDSGSIDLPIAADWPHRPRQKVDHAIGKPALTHYQVLSRSITDNTTRLALQPHTGRTHQLRVHLQAIGHAIVGDTLYADHAANHPAAPTAERLLLHATRLALAHPVTEQTMQWECALLF
jgi:tRNA pseudouridine32 synthase / 23S rRNA pseudouridine746 synthase